MPTLLAFRMNRVHERSLRQCDMESKRKQELKNYTALATLRDRSDRSDTVNADEGRDDVLFG